MRVLMVLDREFPPDLRVENEIDTLIEAGHEVHIACYTRKNKPALEKTGKFFIHRKPISSFTYKSSVASLTLPFYFRFWKKFLQEILPSKPFDVLHVHDLPLVGVCNQLKTEFNLLLVADLHENWPAFLKVSKHTNLLVGKILSPIFLWRKYENKMLRHTDAIIVVVDEAKKRLSKIGISASQICIVSNTINLSEVKEFDIKADHNEIILFYAGGITHHRGLQNVIYAIYYARNPNLRFWILGEGNYKKKLVRITEKLSLQHAIIFKGYQPFEKMMEILQESDYTIIPHLKNEHTDSTIPHKLFQYMFSQKPVIASNCLPVKRIIEETGAGVLYSSGDIMELSRILNNTGSLPYRKMAMKGKEAVLQQYNWQKDGNVLVNLYKSLATGRNPVN